VRTMWRDLRYGLRAMRNQPAFTGLAVLTLALGIGAATTIFSVIQNVLLDPFPYANADKIFVFQIRNPASPRRGDRWFFQVPEFLDYQTHVAAFEEVIAVDAGEDVLYATREGTEHFSGAFVSQHLPVPGRRRRDRPRAHAGRRQARGPSGLRDEPQDVGHIRPGSRDRRPQLRAQQRANDARGDHAAAFRDGRRRPLGAGDAGPHQSAKPRAVLPPPSAAQAGRHSAAGRGRVPRRRRPPGPRLSAALSKDVHGEGRELDRQRSWAASDHAWWCWACLPAWDWCWWRSACTA
jgi:hypothetical protein